MRIDAGYLEDILRDRRFRGVLLEAALFSDTTDREAGFGVIKKVNEGRFTITGMQRGSYTSMSSHILGEAADDVENEEKAWYPDAYHIVSVHFHPGRQGPLVPSIEFNEFGIPNGDLVALQEQGRKVMDVLMDGAMSIPTGGRYDVRPLLGIAKYRGGKTVDLLLIQETRRMVSPNDMAVVERRLLHLFPEDYCSSLSRARALTDEVLSILQNSTLYNAMHVRYGASGPHRDDLTHLGDFGYSELPLNP